MQQPLDGNRRSIAEGALIPNSAIFFKRTCLEFLQILFSTRADYTYDQDNTKTKIQITDLHAVDLDAVNVRPAIVAVRGPITWQGMGIGGSDAGRTIKTGDYRFVDMLTGSVAFSCMSREGIEAENIGHIVFNSFKFFRPVLQEYGFFTIKSLNIGPETLFEQEGEDDKTTVVPIYISGSVPDMWVLEDTAARKLRAIITECMFKVKGE